MAEKNDKSEKPKPLYVACNLDEGAFYDDDGAQIPEDVVRRRWNEGTVDATMMVQRLITQCDWDFARLAQMYEDM